MHTFLLLILVLSNPATGSDKPDLTAEPSHLRSPYLLGAIGDKQVRITFTNSSNRDVILDRFGGIQVLFATAAGEARVINELHPPVEPLLLSPGESLVMNWNVDSLPDELTSQSAAESTVTVKAGYAIASEPQTLYEAIASITVRAPPAWYLKARSSFLASYQNIKSNLLTLLVALFGLRVLLAVYRFSKSATSFSQREPKSWLGGSVLTIWAAVGAVLAKLPLSASTRLSLLLPSLTLFKWKKARGASPQTYLQILRRCEEAASQVALSELTPANPIFLTYWYQAECFDGLAREGGGSRADFAGLIAARYQRAASVSKEENLEELCLALSEFFRAVQARFGNGQMTRPARLDITKAKGAIRSVLWAAEMLRANIEGRDSLLEAVTRAPSDLQYIPILIWAIGPAVDWPPAIAPEPNAKDTSPTRKAIREAESFYSRGEVWRGMIAALKPFTKGRTFSEILAQEGSDIAYTNLLVVAKLYAEHFRLMVTLPFSEEKKREQMERSREFVDMLGRLIQRYLPAGDLGSVALALAISADFFAVWGRFNEAIRCIEGARRFSTCPDRPVLEARGIAERVRGEVYASCGSIQRSYKALTEAATWFAFLGDWTRWIETTSLCMKARLSSFEQRRASTDETVAAARTLRELGASAGLIVARKGHTDLYRSWALWGDYLLAIRSNDQEAIFSVVVRAQRSGKEAGYGPFEVILLRLILLPLGFFVAIHRMLTLSGLSGLGVGLPGMQNTAFLRARRQAHTIIVLSNFHYHKMHLDAHPIASGRIVKMAEKLVKKARLDLPESIRFQTQSAILLAKAESNALEVETIEKAIDLAIDAVSALMNETANAPSDFLRRSISVQRIDVLNQLIWALRLGESALAPDRFDERVRRAYITLQGLRAENWSSLVNQKILAMGGGIDEQINWPLSLQQRLVSLHDRLIESGGRLSRELEFEVGELSQSVPELAVDPSFAGVQRALERIRGEVDESMKQQSELVGRAPDVNTEILSARSDVRVPPGSAVVEYFSTSERACAFIITGVNNHIRYVSLEAMPVPELSHMSGDIVRSVRDLGRLPSAEAQNFNNRLSVFDASLRRIAKAYWPEQLHAHLNDCESVYIVPWDELWKVPFAALPTPAGRPLILEKFVSLLPSIHLLDRAAAQSPGIGHEEITVVAYDSGEDSPYKLTNLEDEIAFLRHRLPAATILEKQHAIPEAVLSAMSNSKWLHVACHGHTDKDAPMFSRLVLAAGGASKDGSLYLYQLNGNFEKLYGVFLNACESNLGDAVGDRPETLAVGFMTVGARVVVGTLGKIYDDVAMEMVRHFYKHLEKHAPHIALSLSLRDLIDSGSTRTVHGSTIPISHPAAWWPFIVIARG